MALPLPQSLNQWLLEIHLAWEDAVEAKPFARMTGSNLSDATMFHLAPIVCLKFRGQELTGKEADKTTKSVLANYILNTSPGAAKQYIESNPKLAFAFCYVATNFVLGFVNAQTAKEILDLYEAKQRE